MNGDLQIEQAYVLARDRFATLGVDCDAAREALSRVAISLHCWQGDDVSGFENTLGLAGSGIQATGNYPGKARTADELRADLALALSLIPGKHRVNLHAIYAEHGGRQIPRNQLGPEQFAGWVDWASARGLGLDFNGSFFSHPLAASGFTLSSRDEGVRNFWIEHGIACRKIGESFGRRLGSPCVTNVWIPDGFKDTPADRATPRTILRLALDRIFAERLDSRHHLDAVEAKLFGIGSESYVVGSHEFYLGYAVHNRLVLCLDSGHFHPTEGIADKISSVLQWLDRILLHVSRPVRWDSDHVVTLSDETRAIAEELVRGDYLGRVHLGLDFFDASINRIAAWVIGMRAFQQALLSALLQPIGWLRDLEANADFTGRLALLEELKAMPAGAVWDYHCLRQEVPVGLQWLKCVMAYEKDVLLPRERGRS